MTPALKWAAVFAAGALVGAAGVAIGQAQASRQILNTITIAGTDREAAMGVATIPAGGAIARHYHPGEELAYVLEGEVTLRMEGQPDRLMKAGDSYAIPRGILHEAVAAPGHDARVVAVWITDKGQPMAIAG